MRRFIDEFKEFAVKGNMLDLAIGIVIGAAFGSIITSLVNDILMPPIGYLIGDVDFSNLFVVLGGGEFDSLQAAQEAGAATINYGLFLNSLINFVIIAFAMFLIVRAFNQMRASEAEEPEVEAPAMRECPFCMTSIRSEATRCPACTSELEPA